ncbi:hypothetical protein AKJ09_09531 [Labilithrix luteola]|uniref:Uncharacterized protein n=1 Tax=Labilithrix luteola TaxID=1391654 RepID=A0A0K1QAV8_9BACT|nr:hypothetical protein [Labilithrix luteola]AKV02868.1 hypothetical protein AKJ09_09531 [Labilithrix luteola]
MILLVRGKSVEEVSGAVAEYAEDDGGLEPFGIDPGNPLALVDGLAGPNVVVSQVGDWVSIANAASLDIADADEWGAALSASCDATVVALDLDEEGVEAFVFDGGDESVTLKFPLGRPSPAPELAALAAGASGKSAFERGILASTHEELLAAVASALGADAPASAGTMLGFADPLDEEGADEEMPRALVIDAAVPSAVRMARVGKRLETMGPLFAVSVSSGAPVLGVNLEIGGDALDLLTIDAIDVEMRLEGILDRSSVTPPVERVGDVFVAQLPLAYIEPPASAGLGLDASDMFGAMQQMMNAGADQIRNTISVSIEARGAKVGQGTLELRALSTDGTLVSEPAAIGVSVTG